LNFLFDILNELYIIINMRHSQTHTGLWPVVGKIVGITGCIIAIQSVVHNILLVCFIRLIITDMEDNFNG
jgi:hypothetical protein